MPPSEIPSPILEFQVDQLQVKIFEDRSRAGRAAAQKIAQAIQERAAGSRAVSCVFAAAPSQNEFLAALVAAPNIDWSRVHCFHMDEYLGLDASHPASFRRYLQEHLFGLVGLGPSQLTLIRGEETDQPLRTCLEYENELRKSPPAIVCAGIGENGHLAFNDPPVADFKDPVLVKVVQLDVLCRRQQVNDGCFGKLEEVPTHALTLTIPALVTAPVVSVVVPGERKAEAVLTALKGPIAQSCPASVLRKSPGATLFLDRASASLLPELKDA